MLSRHTDFKRILSKRLLPWSHFTLLLLGTMMLNQFFEDWLTGHYSSASLHQQLEFLQHHNNAPLLWNIMLNYVAHQTSWFAPLRFAFELVTGLCTILLIARRYMGFVLSAYFFALWISHWAAPGNWAFEYLLPAEFALLSGLAESVSAISNKNFSWQKRYLWGERFCEASFSINKLLLILWVTLLLYYAIDTAANAGPLSFWCALATASSNAILILVITLERWRLPIGSLSFQYYHQGQPMGWVNVAVISLGAMLVLQLYGDHAIHWFTVKGYRSLVENYYQQTTAPSWWRVSLYFSAQHVQMLLPLQIIFETAIAIGLVLLIGRAPILTVSTLFFMLLTLSEFGVSAKWPAHPNDPRTWTWELLFTTLITAHCTLIYWQEWLKKPNRKILWFGYDYFNLRIAHYFLLAIFCGLLLTAIGWVTHFFGPAYRLTSILAGSSLFVLILLQGWLQQWRYPMPKMNSFH